MSEKTITAFPGGEIDVAWDGRLCIHVAECGQAKGDLFVAGRQPWCEPDVDTRDEVRDIVERCPSGALTYIDKSGAPETAAAENTVSVSCSGPLFARGDLRIEGAPEDMPGVRVRAALCRCGASKNKPFCDGSHEVAGFKDYGAVGERGKDTGGRGGRLDIKPLKDGPLMVSGNVTLLAGSGRVAWHGNSVALCRCGASKNKPFCDGSHKATGFKTD
jgi:CDGSH-type Zn-finger protein/uncharacterized Fe-S cluster protein YjdI